MKPRTLREALRGHDNGFGLLRLVLATLVLVDHAFPLGGFGGDALLRHDHQQESFGGLAVLGFFAISGYLVTRSAMTNDVLQFAWHRVLRLFPAYWVMLVVTGFVVGPVLWVRSGYALGHGYFTTSYPGPFTFFTRNWRLGIGQWGLHNLLATTTPYGRLIHGSAVNGSIWTLLYEWHCYVIVACLLMAGVLTRYPVLLLAMTTGMLGVQFAQAWDPTAPAKIAPFLADTFTIQLTTVFLVGAVLATYADRVPIDDRLGVAAGLVVAATLRYGGFLTIGAPVGAYFVLWIAARTPARLRWVGQRTDISYGVYIYGFLVQQVLAFAHANRAGYWPFLLLSIAVSCAFGWVSWHVVERPALQLKGRGPGRGFLPLWNAVTQRRRALRQPSTIRVPAGESDVETVTA